MRIIDSNKTTPRTGKLIESMTTKKYHTVKWHNGIFQRVKIDNCKSFKKATKITEAIKSDKRYILVML